MNAFGTRVVVYADGRQFMRTLSTSSAGSRVATNTTELHFGLGNASRIDSAVVLYPNATRMKLTTLEPNMRYKLAYGGEPTVHAGMLAAPSSWSIENATVHNGSLFVTLLHTRPLENVQIEIVDVLGRQVVRIGVVLLQPGLQSFHLPVRPGRGVHFVTVRSDNAVQTVKLPILH